MEEAVTTMMTLYLEIIEPFLVSFVIASGGYLLIRKEWMAGGVLLAVGICLGIDMECSMKLCIGISLPLSMFCVYGLHLLSRPRRQVLTGVLILIVYLGCIVVIIWLHLLRPVEAPDSGSRNNTTARYDHFGFVYSDFDVHGGRKMQC